MNFEISEINKKIHNCLEKASVGIDTISSLLVDGKFVPKEG
jgi:hypothetical protein